LDPEVLARDLAPFLERLHPDDRPRLRAEFLRAREAHGPLHVEFRYRHPDGREIWLESLSAPQSEPGGGMVWHGVVADVTARKAAEARLLALEASLDEAQRCLRESNDRFDRLFTIGPAAKMLVRVRDRRIVRANDAAARLMGCACEALVGLSAPSPTLQLTPAAQAWFWAIAADTEPCRSVAVEIERRDGSRLYCEQSREVVRFGGDDYVFILLVDLTARHRGEQALRESEGRLREITDSMSEGLWLFDVGSGKVLYTNQALWRLLGREPSTAFTVQDWQAAIHPDDAAIHDRRKAELQHHSTGRTEATYRIVRPNGEVRWVRSRAHVTASGAAGQGQRVIAAFEDVTEARATEQRLHQAQKMESMGQLASGVAHDFNNWLTVIIGYVELLGTMVPGESMASKCVAEIRRASERATGLTRQLLAFSRNEPIEPRVVDVNLLVADTQRMLRRLLGEDIKLVSALDPGAGRVKVDPTQWVQVLTNLAVNARDAMPTGGTLTVATSAATVDPERAAAHGVPPGRYVCLSVSDTGCGIPREVQVRVFEPFFTTKAVGKGTGLGLAVVFAAVERSGGFLELTSSAGAGAQFRLYVPEALECPAAASVGPAGVIDGSERVLVVEDEGSLRDVACQTLRSHGYDVLQAADGAQAIGILAEQGADIDVLFTDVVMPDKGGREVVEAARAQWPHIRVIYTSGYTDEAISRRGVLHGEAPFLQKPYTPRELLTTIRSVMA